MGIKERGQMQSRQIIRAKRYLYRFDEIVNQMAKEMLEQEKTNSITIKFIEGIIPHHQATIKMSENLLIYTTYQPLKEIARNIIKMKTEELEELKEIARTTYNYYNMPQEISRYQERYLEITKEMLEKIKNTPKTMYINLDFTYKMIPHHEGAIRMCENLLAYRIEPRLKIVADSIIKEQTESMQNLKENLKKLSGK